MHVRVSRVLISVTLVTGIVVACEEHVLGATKNCNSTQCIVVGYTANTDNPPKNTLCWISSAGARAYSATYSNTGYGTDSQGGNPETMVNGNYWKCNGNFDCPGTSPGSGTVTGYIGTGSVNSGFTTECSGSG
jgi:hypothetical protein